VKGNQNMWLPVSPKEIESDKIKNYIHVFGKQSGQLTLVLCCFPWVIFKK